MTERGRESESEEGEIEAGREGEREGRRGMRERTKGRREREGGREREDTVMTVFQHRMISNTPKINIVFVYKLFFAIYVNNSFNNQEKFAYFLRMQNDARILVGHIFCHRSHFCN